MSKEAFVRLLKLFSVLALGFSIPWESKLVRSLKDKEIRMVRLFQLYHSYLSSTYLKYVCRRSGGSS